MYNINFLYGKKIQKAIFAAKLKQKILKQQKYLTQQ
jgi:hypothetical protein